MMMRRFAAALEGFEMKTRNCLSFVLTVICPLLLVESAQAYFHPGTGRFISRDPIHEVAFESLQMPQLVVHPRTVWISAETPIFSSEAREYMQADLQEFNEYGYVVNDPLNKHDPLGLAYKQCIIQPPKNKRSDCSQVRRKWYRLSLYVVCVQRKCVWRCYCPGDDNCYRIPCPDKSCEGDHGVEELRTYGPSIPTGIPRLLAAPRCPDKTAEVVASGKCGDCDKPSTTQPTGP